MKAEQAHYLTGAAEVNLPRLDAEPSRFPHWSNKQCYTL